MVVNDAFIEVRTVARAPLSGVFALVFGIGSERLLGRDGWRVRHRDFGVIARSCGCLSNTIWTWVLMKEG